MTKNTLLIFTAILLVGGSFVYAEYINREPKNVYVSSDSKSLNNANEIAVLSGVDAPQNIDIDGDGSKDWEEILAGTNPEDPKSKPSDNKTATVKDLTAKKPEALSQIDSVSREFFARYMELRQTGLSTDKANQQDLVQKTAGNIVLSKPAVYLITEILTKPDTDNSAIKAYGDEVASIFKKYATQSRNEAIIAKQSLEQEDLEMLKEIDPSIESYKNIINSLIKIRVPQSLVTMHLDLMNAMNGSLFIAQSFRNSGVNPIEGLQAIAYYPTAEKKLFDSLNAIKSYLKYLGLYENIF